MWGLDSIHELLETDERLLCIRQGRLVPDDITYIDGLPAATVPARQFEIACTIQPMGGRDLLLQPEAFRSKDMLSCWQAHRTVEQDVVRLDVGDVVLFRQTAYQVQGAEDWESYTKATLCAIDVGSFAGILDPENLPPLYPSVSTPEPIPAPTPVPTPTPTPEPTPTPIPSPVEGDEELDVLQNPYDLYDVGVLSLQEYFNQGDVYDFRVPGDPSHATFRYRFPRAGYVFGFTITGSIDSGARVGAYITRRDAKTGMTNDAFHLDPYQQTYFNVESGIRVTLETPIAYAQDDIVQMKVHLGDSSSVNFAGFFQVGLTKVGADV